MAARGLVIVIGQGVLSGPILSEWPGLEKDALDEVGDLPAANDYQTMLREVLQGGLGFGGEFFPGAQRRFCGLFD